MNIDATFPEAAVLEKDAKHHIIIKGARVHNLRNVNVAIPRNKLVVVTGVSGSGKSSLTIDTLYAEGQRRYVESLSSYARQFLTRMDKPDVDYIKGISPAIAIEQKVITRTSRSTVGSLTEIYEYLRLLFARIGKTYSPVSGDEVKKHHVSDVVNYIFQLPEDTKLNILIPFKPHNEKKIAQELEVLMQKGYSRIKCGNDIIRIDELLTDKSLFDEGYHSSTQKTHLRKELCLEAMRLNYLLIENETTNKPIVNALMALMCFHASRFEARTNEIGEPILYDQQDKALWNEELIAKGNFYLIQSAKGNEISKYHLEANIAYWHSSKMENPQKWNNILQAYNQLLLIEYSPITALNRTYVLAQVKGKQTAIIEAEKLNLTDNHFYYSLLGNLYTDLDNGKAISYFEMALQKAKTDNDKSQLNKKINDLKKNNS